MSHLWLIFKNFYLFIKNFNFHSTKNHKRKKFFVKGNLNFGFKAIYIYLYLF